MPAVHVNNNSLSYLDGALSNTFNDTLRKSSEGDVESKELLTEINGIGLNLVKAIPGQSIIIFVYCKTVQNAAKFMQLFNSGRLRHMLERILNRLLLTIEPCSKENLESRISLEDEEINTLAEFTGIEGTCIYENIFSLICLLLALSAAYCSYFFTQHLHDK